MAEWAVPEYTLEQVNRAGTALLTAIVPTPEYDRALKIINNWRAAHAFPLNTLQIGLKERSERVEGAALTAQRIKRLHSISSKLDRFPTMRLAQMQDIGGCRAVMSSVNAVDKVIALHKESRVKHALVGEKDYIREPAASGYRGVHLVYAYKSDRKPTYNGLRIEVQVRSLRQHLWATAVETVGTMTRQALKSSLGEQKWLRFFSLMGTAMAHAEGTPLVPGTPTRKSEWVAELRSVASDLHVAARLAAYREALREIAGPARDKDHYYILRVQPAANTVTIESFERGELAAASARYLMIEREIANEPGAEAVLVSVQSLAQLRRAYPNYFLDTHLFVEELGQAIET